MKFSTALCVLLIGVMYGLVPAQTKRRLIERTLAHDNEPVAIMGYALDDQPTGKDILGGPDWLGHLRVEIKNTSPKAISRAEILVLMDVKVSAKSQLSIPIFFPNGQGADRLEDLPNGRREVKLLYPNETVRLHALRGQLRLLDDLEQAGGAEIIGVKLMIASVTFIDGTEWIGGVYRQASEGSSNTPVQKTPYVQDLIIAWLESIYEQQFKTLYEPVPTGFFHFRTISPQPDPTPSPECGWLDGGFPKFCLTSSEGNCGEGVGSNCSYEDQRIYFDNRGSGDFGYVSYPTSYWCSPASGSSDGSCNSCSSFAKPVWSSDAACGQPHSCALTSRWGCVSPLVDVNGVCERSVSYQNACPSPGYDSTACACATPTPSPTPPPQSECAYPVENFSHSSCPYMYFGDTGGNYCCEGPACVEQHDDCLANSGSWHGCSLGCLSPILIDVNGDGFALTDAAQGVDFDPAATGSVERLSWTAGRSDDAWLVLDRNENGAIDSAFEMFGNYTDQDLTAGRNGFAALAMFDKLNAGGNGDGKITRQDVIFSSLRLWQDTNHNGISEPEELHPLPDLGVNQIDLNYRTSKRTDEYGNRFRYRAKINATGRGPAGRWAWDVFLLKQ